MAVLSDPDRVTLWAEQMRRWSHRRETLAVLTKTDIRAAVNAVDAWADANASAFNAAIPLPARTALTARQKAELLMLVLIRRYEVA